MATKNRAANAAAPVSVTWQESGFPPYGHISRDYRLHADQQAVPPKFKIGGRPGSAPEWAAYVDREVALMADFLWPRCDRATQSWVGMDRAKMEALTRADLGLMKSLSEKLQLEASFPLPVAPPAPTPTAPVPAAEPKPKGLERSHLDLFYAEDRSARPTLAVYLPKLEAGLLADVDKAVGEWLEGYGDAHIFFKLQFQRPRPYQMSYLLGIAGDDYVYRFGASAATPSLISGHSFSGLLVRCGALLDKRLVIERQLHGLAAMKQYMADIGDRRVFAGVHYPSDNLASWFCALRLCDHFFSTAGQDAKDLMWAAISKHSAVYKAMADAVAADAANPYAEPLRRLQAEADRPAFPNATVA
jgi:hypothetical protein